MTEENPDSQGAGSGPVWSFEYDAAGQLIKVTDPLDRVTDYDYDALGRLVTEIFPDIDGDPGTDDRPEFTYTYDKAGNLVSVTDALDNVTVYGYDYRDRITTITDPDPDGPLTTHQSPVTSFTYDDANRLTKIIDPLSRVTDYRYDGLNRLIKAFYPDADGDPQTTGDRPEISYSYDALGNQLSMTDALGNITSYEYDDLYRLIELTEPDPDGPVGQASSPVTSFQYDAASQLLEVTDPLARTTAYDYDGLGRVTKETYPDPDSGDAGPNSPFMEYVYDLAGNLLSQTDALGHATSYGYDNLYRMTSETDANADTVDFTYDLVGNLATLTDPPTDENPTGNTTMWVYDSLDRVTEERNDVGDSRFFVYDLMNNLVERTDRNGRVIQFDYDQLYRRTAERWLDATETTIHTIGYTYDAAGQVLSAGDVFANYGYTYDGLSRVTQVTHDIADLVPVIEMNQQFDLMNNRTQLAAVIGGTADFVTDYGYDNLHRMTRVEQAFSLLPGGHAVAEKRIDLAYDLAGQFQSITRFADLAATKLVAQSDFTFDLTGRLTDLVHSTLNSQPSTLASYTWTFDVANRVTQFESLSDGIVNYTYDYRDQLKTADYNYQTDEDYVYDENGNRTSYSSSLTGGGQEGVVTGDLNRLLDDGTYTYAYDAEGNRTARFVDVDDDGDLSTGDTSVTLYGWDHRNRLVTITTYDDDPEENPQASKLKEVTQIYDAYNRWIGRKVDDDGDGTVDTETFFIYDGNQIVLQFDGTEVTSLTHRYLWGPAVDQILADEVMTDLETVGDVLWPLTDNLGTVRDLAEYDDATDTTAIVDHFVWDSFGNETSGTFDDFLFGFTGRPFDHETGSQNNWERWYDATVGRWLSEDPIGFAAGDANVYRYVGNFATGATDPSGLEVALQPVPVDQFKPAVQIASQTFKPDPSNAKRNTAILEGVVAAAKAAGLKNVSGVLNTRETAFMGRLPGLVISVRGVDCEGNKFHITAGLKTGKLRITVQEKIQPLQAGMGAGALRLLPRLLQLFGQGAKNPYLVQSVALSAALAGVGGALITELIEFFKSAEFAATTATTAGGTICAASELTPDEEAQVREIYELMRQIKERTAKLKEMGQPPHPQDNEAWDILLELLETYGTKPP